MNRDGPWRAANRVTLLENGETFFARAFKAIAAAKREVLLETFIFFEDKVGLELQRELVKAARRGARVEVTVDGYGSPAFSPEFLAELTEAGVTLRTFDPHRPLLGVRLHIFRRMHRKLLVVDDSLAFVGGINFAADHLGDFGPCSKQDYAVELEGPIVADIRDFVASAMGNDGSHWSHPRAVDVDADADADVDADRPGDAEVLFVVRDNGSHSNDIERRYRAAIRAARREVVIANAYFFPGYGLLRDLRHAARRGVQVSLIVQGEPDMPFAMSAARTLYRHLIADGVRIHEYCTRPFHGKVALFDDEWATVGSSNLDPLSLSLNLEANVFIRDRAFNDELRERLRILREEHCQAIDPRSLPRRPMWRVPAPLLYHALRRFPAWAGLLPAHTPRVVQLAPTVEDSVEQR